MVTSSLHVHLLDTRVLCTGRVLVFIHSLRTICSEQMVQNRRSDLIHRVIKTTRDRLREVRSGHNTAEGCVVLSFRILFLRLFNLAKVLACMRLFSLMLISHQKDILNGIKRFYHCLCTAPLKS